MSNRTAGTTATNRRTSRAIPPSPPRTSTATAAWCWRDATASIVVWQHATKPRNGPNFERCYDWIKSFDPSRPVQYEQASYHGDYNTDIVCPMYWSYEQCGKYLAADPEKPLIQCEYAHAMGNSLGGFEEPGR